jgi:Asp-tRNA(Asn)/Glu-tRNA(Gln) amidotransferase A subunit family amidase
MDPTQLGTVALARAIRERQLSPVDAVEAYLARIERLNPSLNAIVTLTAEEARAGARQAEAALMTGGELPPLLGVPFTVKDGFDTVGVRTTWGSRVHAERVPRRDATLVRRLREAGGILLGKTNVPEYLMSQFTDNRLFGPTRNPYQPERSAGGSSGGEAAALAAGLSAAGIGSDLGGSLRIPAHCCGIAALRPTLGRCPTTGHVGAGPAHLGTMATAGPMARNVEDLALLLSVLEGPDDADPFAQPLPATEPWLRPASGLRVGLLDLSAQSPVAAEVKEAVRKAAEQLAEGGGHVEPADDPAFQDIYYAWGVLTTFGYPPSIAGLRAKRELLDPRFARLLDVESPSVEAFLEADLKRARITRAFFQLYGRLDVIVSPVLPTTAPVGDEGPVVDGQPQRLIASARHTYAAVLTGDPAVAVPVGVGADGLPIGVQVSARRGRDTLALAAALTLERARRPIPPPLRDGVR